MNLELKHLIPYLPYRLYCCLMGKTDEETEEPIQFLIEGVNSSYVEVWSLKTITDEFEYSEVFPILRPLSYLTKEIEHDGKKFIPFEKIAIYKDVGYLIENLKLGFIELIVYNQLIKWKFDVSGLIDNNLAIAVTENFNPYK